MNLKAIRDYLGRVKVYHQRNDTLHALATVIAGLKGIDATAQLPLDIRTLIRDAVQLLGRDQKIRALVKGPLLYQPGEETALLRQLALAYKSLREESVHEDREATLARKIRLDQALNQGMKHLEQGRVSEADASFADAVNSYKDEHRIFYLIGKALMDAAEVRRALPYLKRGAAVEPDTVEVIQLFEECQQQRDALKGR